MAAIVIAALGDKNVNVLFNGHLKDYVGIVVAIKHRLAGSLVTYLFCLGYYRRDHADFVRGIHAYTDNHSFIIRQDRWLVAGGHPSGFERLAHRLWFRGTHLRILGFSDFVPASLRAFLNG